MLRGSISRLSRTSIKSGHAAALTATLVAVAGLVFVGTRLVLHGQQQPKHIVAAPPVAAVPTLAHPLPSFAKQTTLADAPATLGGPVVLPDSPVAAPETAGTVWVASLGDAQTGPSETTVAVTFPTQGLIFEYTRPAPSDGSAAHFQAMAQGAVSPTGAQIAQVITLSGGVPALAVQQNSDATGANFGEVIFNTGGTEVRVMGHSPEETLQSLAESILARSAS